ncbi:hypothetical protein HJFPF1_02080 [Paramyrothecium foliicola]|nr:hypothetical protein HJFPF1_02080 [Paramyrothecium foliicola]
MSLTIAFSLIAIMLGRLRMSIQESIEAYKVLSPVIFKKKWWSNVTFLKMLGAEMSQNWFEGKNLEEAIRSLLSQKQLDPDTDLREPDEESLCKV